MKKTKENNPFFGIAEINPKLISTTSESKHEIKSIGESP